MKCDSELTLMCQSSAEVVLSSALCQAGFVGSKCCSGYSGFAYCGPVVEWDVSDLWACFCPLRPLSPAAPSRCRTSHLCVSSAALSSFCWTQEVVGCAEYRRVQSGGDGYSSCLCVLLLCPLSRSMSWNSFSCPSSTPPQ